MQRFDSAGVFQSQWSSWGGDGDGDFESVSALGALADGSVFVVSGQIHHFDAAGAFLDRWGSGLSENVQLSGPQGVDELEEIGGDADASADAPVALAVEGDDLVQRRVSLQQAGAARRDQPTDLRFGEAGAESIGDGQRVDHVAERARLDDQDAPIVTLAQIPHFEPRRARSRFPASNDQDVRDDARTLASRATFDGFLVGTGLVKAFQHEAGVDQQVHPSAQCMREAGNSEVGTPLSLN